MTLIAHVAAEFHNPRGETVFTVSPRDIDRILTHVPEAVREDPLFPALGRDGSLRVTEDAKERKALERDPAAGVAPDGRKAASRSPRASDAKAEAPEKPSAAPVS